MLIPSHLQLEPSNSRTRVPAGGIDLIASIDFKSDGATTATLSSSTKVSHGEDTISSAEVATPNHSNQQYSIYAITDAAANIAERYAYTAYGQPAILDAAAAVIATSAISNRYTYTAREWDATVGLYHFRARWMSGLTGRFLSRDPIGFEGSEWNLYEYCVSSPLIYIDPTGLSIRPRPVSPDDIFFPGENWSPPYPPGTRIGRRLRYPTRYTGRCEVVEFELDDEACILNCEVQGGDSEQFRVWKGYKRVPTETGRVIWVDDYDISPWSPIRWNGNRFWRNVGGPFPCGCRSEFEHANAPQADEISDFGIPEDW